MADGFQFPFMLALFPAQGCFFSSSISTIFLSVDDPFLFSPRAFNRGVSIGTFFCWIVPLGDRIRLKKHQPFVRKLYGFPFWSWSIEHFTLIVHVGES